VALETALALPAWSAPAERKATGALDTAKIEELTGEKGTMDAKEGVFKVSLPRKDISATAAGVKMTPPLGLTAWAAFMRAGKHAMVMGDMVMLEDQVNPVMSVALDNGLEVTALHNHFFWDTPKIMFMHVGGMGDEDPKKIEALLGGYKGELASGVYKVVIGRTTKMGPHTVGKAMGVNTWAAFAGSDDKAVVDGDFAMLESELQAVLKALRGGGINVVAIHNHMTGENPRILFLHYWGTGSTEALARTLKSALDQTKHLPPAP
jgi:Domain of Unknown Function (DUF1259)